MKLHYGLILFVTLILSDCASYGMPTSLASPTTAFFLSPTYTVLPSPTLTPLRITETPKPLAVNPTPITLPIRSITKKCAVLKEKASSDFLTAGNILFVDNTQKPDDRLLMLLKPGSQKLMPLLDAPQFVGYESTSADGQWFAYFSHQTELVVLSSDGKVQSRWKWKHTWKSVQSWFKGNQMMIDFDNLVTHSYFIIELFNPFTGKSEIIDPHKQDIYPYLIENNSPYIWKLSYDPTLTRLAYMRKIGEGKYGTESPIFTMFDVENNQTLWELNRVSPGLNHQPVWFPDGSKMAVLASGDSEYDFKNFELYVVTREGQAQQWIELNDHPEIVAQDIKWSPNARYIAISGKSVYILDLQEKILLDFCIPTSETGWNNNSFDNLIMWSPDSRQVIFLREGTLAVVINLEDRSAIPFPEDIHVQPIAWLKAH